MKKFIARGMFIFLGLFATLTFNSAQSCEIYDHANERIKDLDFFITKFQIEHEYKYDESFFMGYLKGQLQAYEEIKALIDDLYPN